jgi:hypothetical protein
MMGRFCWRSVMVVVVWVLLVPTVRAQESSTSYYLGARTHMGYIIAHRPGMGHLIQSHTKAIDLFYEKQTDGSQPWHHTYNFPTWGINFSFVDLGNTEELGKSASIISFASFPLIKKEKFQLNQRVGLGLGFVQKPFDSEENHKNIAIGSVVNSNIVFSLEAQRHFGRLSLSGGVVLTHYSNAAFTMPNLGLNIPSIQLSAAYLMDDRTPDPERNEIPEVDKSWDIRAMAGFGFKEINPPGGKKYGAYVASAIFRKPFTPKSTFVTGLDLFYNSSIIGIWDQDTTAYSSKLSAAQIGINAGYSFTLDAFNIYLNMGAYALSEYKEKGTMYHRLGISYLFNNRMVVGCALKTHWTVADYFEMHIGYKIK